MYASTAEQQRCAQVQALATEFYAERREYLLHIARRNGAKGEDAEEALQDAFISFIEHFDPATEAPPLAWLTLTMKCRCWALYRQQRLDRSNHRQAQVDFGKPGLSVESNRFSAASPEEAIERAEQVAEARAQLARLKPAERRALCLIAAGYSYREIGQITGWSYTKTNRCLAEGRARLRELGEGER
jgi:RNA polymerase sigma factor (sigma-70 family)